MMISCMYGDDDWNLHINNYMPSCLYPSIHDSDCYVQIQITIHDSDCYEGTNIPSCLYAYYA